MALPESEFTKRHKEFLRTALPGEELFADTGVIVSFRKPNKVHIQRGNINDIVADELEALQTITKPARKRVLGVSQLAAMLPTILV